jgi:hypothetical protein
MVAGLVGRHFLHAGPDARFVADRCNPAQGELQLAEIAAQSGRKLGFREILEVRSISLAQALLDGTVADQGANCICETLRERRHGRSLIVILRKV